MFILDIIKSTLTITCLVMVMLLLIEFVNVSSSGRLMERLRHKPVLQVLLAALLGLVPGCLGGFTIVSLFTHKLLSFGALVAGMISTFGDEAFVIFAYSPKVTLILAGCLVGIGIVAGILTDVLFRKRRHALHAHDLEIHHDHDHERAHLSFAHLRKLSFPRASLLFGLVVYLIAILTGTFSHEHGAMPEVAHQHHHHTEASCAHHTCDETQCADYQEVTAEEEGAHHHHAHGVWSWENIIFALLALFTVVIVALSSEHFLQSHLWEHVIKKHFLSVLLWTFGVLLFLKVLYYFVDVSALIGAHEWALLVIMLLAILVGIVPESGPHLIFVVMYFSGAIPFSILLVSSIVQDGHGALPLLADSRRYFFMMKAVNVLVGLAVGLLGYFLGF